MNPERIDQLKNPAVYPHPGEEVEIVQTHISVVCLFGDFAYKLKKAIKLPFGDFSTLENRRHFCEEELRLNRRLCPDIYLEVTTLCQSSQGQLGFAADGEVIDYAVVMKRLPADRMMDVLLERDEVTIGDIREIAAIVTEFHARSERTEEIDQLSSPDTLREYALQNFEDTQAATGSIFCPALHRSLEQRTVADFERWLPLLRKRVEEGRAVDGHGDLHARNICLTDPIAIYDCIEFQPAFRCGDVASEHAFFLMDLRYRGHRELAAAYLDAIHEKSGDTEMKPLLPMLMQYRAMVRAKVASFAAAEDEFSEEERKRSIETARHYLHLSAALAVEDGGPWWILLCGLPGTGKSTLAEGLSRLGGWPVFSSDRIRKELAGVSPGEELEEIFYSREFSERTYEEIYRRATNSGERLVILDANFRTRRQRSATAEAAKACGAKPCIVLVKIDRDIQEKRLVDRKREGGAVSDADVEVLRKLEAEFETPVTEEAEHLVVADGSCELSESYDTFFESLLRKREKPSPKGA